MTGIIVQLGGPPHVVTTTFGGLWAALPVELVEPTPYQRDPSDA
jgi:hypothetical protein